MIKLQQTLQSSKRKNYGGIFPSCVFRSGYVLLDTFLIQGTLSSTVYAYILVYSSLPMRALKPAYRLIMYLILKT
jgi:hypothetical protein